MLNANIHVIKTGLPLSTAVWVFLTILPSLMLNAKKQDKPLCTRDYVGWSMWIIGFLFEVMADYQKSAFRNNPDNAVRN